MTSFEDKISLMIPAYLRGELSSEDMEKIDSLAAQNPDIAADIDFQKHLKASLKSGKEVFEPGEMGWARLSKAMEQTESDGNDGGKSSAFWKYAAVFFAVAAIGQAGLLASNTINKDDGPQYVMATDSVTKANVIKIGPHPDLPLRDFAQSLRSVQGNIVEGPSALGLFHVQFQSKSACHQAVDRLIKKTDIIEIITPCE